MNQVSKRSHTDITDKPGRLKSVYLPQPSAHSTSQYPSSALEGSWSLVPMVILQGYSVRGTVRSESKGEHLKNVFKEYGDKVEVVVGYHQGTSIVGELSGILK